MELSLGLCSFIFLFGFTSVVIMVTSLCQSLQTDCNGRFSISLPERGKCPCSKHDLHQPRFISTMVPRRFVFLPEDIWQSEGYIGLERVLCVHVLSSLMNALDQLPCGSEGH